MSPPPIPSFPKTTRLTTTTDGRQGTARGWRLYIPFTITISVRRRIDWMASRIRRHRRRRHLTCFNKTRIRHVPRAKAARISSPALTPTLRPVETH